MRAQGKKKLNQSDNNTVDTLETRQNHVFAVTFEVFCPVVHLLSITWQQNRKKIDFIHFYLNKMNWQMILQKLGNRKSMKQRFCLLHDNVNILIIFKGIIELD